MTKPVIVTRASKGSALSWTEGDTNLTNLRDATITVSDGTTSTAIDLNGTITFSAGSGISVDESSGTITIANTQSAGASQLPDLSDVTITTPSTGQVLTYTASGQWENQTASSYTDSQARTAISVTDSGGDGSLSYNNTTGEITYTGPSASDVRAHFSGGTAISITDGVVAFTGTQASGNELENVVEDTTPQLGGNLDAQGYIVSNPVLKDYAETVYSIGSNDSPTITIANGNVQSVSITSGLALPAFSDAATGQSVTLLVSGTGTASGASGYKFAGGNKTLTNFSVVSIFYDGTTYWCSIATDFQV